MRHNAVAKVLGLMALVITVSLIFTAQASLQNNFWTDAAQLNMSEIALGNLGVQKSQNEQVRQFAQQMVTEHTAVGEELATAAAAKNVTLPAAVSAKQAAAFDQLNKTDAAGFDGAFMEAMESSHQAAVRLFEKQSKSDSDADAKAFAAKHLPALQQHLQAARSLRTTLKGGAAANTSNTNSGNSDSMGNMHMDGSNHNAANNRNSRMNTNAANSINTNTGTNTNSGGNTNPRTNTNTTNTNSNSTINTSNANTSNVNSM